MANEEKNYSPDFKIKLAKEALDQSKKNLDTLADKYDVPVSLILMWTAQYEKKGAEAFEAEAEAEESKSEVSEEEPETVDVEVEDEDVARSVEYGVMSDDLNIRRLVFWSILGIVIVLIFIQALYEMYHYNEQVAQERVSAESQYYQVNELRSEQNERLSNFGVVDLENGVYRIPIDSAINEMAADSE